MGKNRTYILLLTTLTVVGLLLLWFLKHNTIFFFPQYEYAHVRIRVFISGEEKDVGENPNGTRLFPGACAAILQSEPLATIFKDPHTVRLMWKNISSETFFSFLSVLPPRKDGVLGYAVSKTFGWKKIAAQQRPLVVQPKNTSLFFFIRTGDGFTERPIDTWQHRTIEDLFGRNSQIRVSWMRASIASAHEEENSINTTSTDPLIIAQEQEEARRLNNVLGESVLFIQRERPDEATVKNAFDTFPPLSGSLCDEVR